MYVRVRVTPGAKKESFIEIDEKTFSASVREPAERNLANTRVKELVAEHFGVSSKKVRLTGGHTSPRKIFDIDI